MVGAGQVAATLEDRSFRHCLLALVSRCINNHVITNTTSLQSKPRPAFSFFFKQPNGGFVAPNFYRDNRRAPGDWLLAPDDDTKPKCRSSSFLQTMINQQSYTKTADVRKPPADVVASMQRRGERRVLPPLLFIPTPPRASRPPSSSWHRSWATPFRWTTPLQPLQNPRWTQR